MFPTDGGKLEHYCKRGGGGWNFSHEHLNLEKREHWSNCCKGNFSLTLRFTSRSKTVLEEMDQSTPTGFDKNHKKHIKVKNDIKRNYRNCSIKMCKIWTTRFDKNHKKHIKD